MVFVDRVDAGRRLAMRFEQLRGGSVVALALSPQQWAEQ